ncbi:MAG: periplasmic heavy metal sensor, partial [Rickettsiales bacterium]|nr:periplasmic heavy metal sensor [Rickettsiales bacterium]
MLFPRRFAFRAASALALASVLALGSAPAAWAQTASKTTTKVTETTKLTTPAKTVGAAKRISVQKMQAYNDTLKAARLKNATNRLEMQKLRDDLATIVTAPNFDKAAYISKSNEIEKINMQIRMSLAEANANALAQLSPEERTMMAQAAQ